EDGIRDFHVTGVQTCALPISRRNLSPHAGRVALDFRWHDVTAGLPAAYDVIVSNPPFHGHGRTARPDIGRAFIAAAAGALVPGEIGRASCRGRADIRGGAVAS